MRGLKGRGDERAVGRQSCGGWCDLMVNEMALSDSRSCRHRDHHHGHPCLSSALDWPH